MKKAQFRMVYSGPYAPGAAWVHKNNRAKKHYIDASISVGEMYTEWMDDGQFGRSIARAVAAGIDWQWMLCYRKENDKLILI